MMARYMPLSRRGVLLLATGLTLGPLPTFAANAVLPVPMSLADELAKALKSGQPLVVMVSLDGCPYCRVARDHYLDPLRRQDGAYVVQIDMRTNKLVQDFDGVLQTHDSVVRAWGVKVAPTVLFFGPRGKEIAERLVGAVIPDFYGAYLDQRLQTARAVTK